MTTLRQCAVFLFYAEAKGCMATASPYVKSIISLQQIRYRPDKVQRGTALVEQTSIIVATKPTATIPE
jgi:hypothetical protein